jgi:16S rRNA processing protein RimM
MFIAIGKIIKLHGIKGYVKVVSYAGILERFSNLTSTYVELEGETNCFILEDVILADDSANIKFKKINTREEAAPLVGKELLVPYEERVKLPADIFFIHDLIGLEVFDIDGNYLGLLKDVFQMGGNDVYQVNDGKREILVPGVSEFVKEISLKEKKMTVHLIEGMVE